jgi:hypothetical protein
MNTFSQRTKSRFSGGKRYTSITTYTLVVHHRLSKAWAETSPLAISLVTYTDPITECSEYKYLGFIIQNDLKWTSMTAARLAKTQTLINRLLLHKHAFRNVSLLAAKRIWTTYGRPILEYGVALWATQKNHSKQTRHIAEESPKDNVRATQLHQL